MKRNVTICTNVLVSVASLLEAAGRGFGLVQTVNDPEPISVGCSVVAVSSILAGQTHIVNSGEQQRFNAQLAGR